MTFAEWATRLRAESFPRVNMARRTFAAGYLLWPTMVASDADRGPTVYSRGNPGLLEAARLWATMVTSDAENASRAYAQGGQPLGSQAMLWATMLSTDAHGHGYQQDSRTGRKYETLVGQSRQLHFHLQGMTFPDGGSRSQQPLVLNPSFGEWKLGFPIGWTALGHLAPACRPAPWLRPGPCSGPASETSDD